jgi:hypothetical protein
MQSIMVPTTALFWGDSIEQQLLRKFAKTVGRALSDQLIRCAADMRHGLITGGIIESAKRFRIAEAKSVHYLSVGVPDRSISQECSAQMDLRAILRVANMGKFPSDRKVGEYAAKSRTFDPFHLANTTKNVIDSHVLPRSAWNLSLE